ncbi:protein transport [Geosmithia morbida]|uniref:Protein transport n=1 Tax=Geosmithia morbida TaxID=1094350 RepID=A0A9P4YWG7_9HYPO|nr:protein transport [Geosmithia morbida]KAF4124373.1 protein transport [Geosmithia morbida]
MDSSNGFRNRFSHGLSRSNAADVEEKTLFPDPARQKRPGLGSRQVSSASIGQIEQIVLDAKIDTETFGVSETRDGFFDALFLKSSFTYSPESFREHAEATLPRAFDKGEPLSPRYFVKKQFHELNSLLTRVTTTRSGVRLAKTFMAFFAAYVLCLVPAVHDWLGRYSYIMPVSVIFNHPSRPVGSQIDGAIFTTLGTAAGIGWGVVGLLLSTSTLAAQAGFGGILAMFLAIFMGINAWIRACFVRFYQAVLCAGMAIIFTTLTDTSSRDIEWSKLRSYAISWVLGQAIALIINCVVFPDAGARPLAVTILKFFDAAQDALTIPRARDVRLRRVLARAYVDLSTAYRDMQMDITITRVRPKDFGQLRNLMQAVIRSLLTMETETTMFSEMPVTVMANHAAPSSGSDKSSVKSCLSTAPGEDASRKVKEILATPTSEVLECMREGLRRGEAALMDLSGYRKHMGPASDVSSHIGSIQVRLSSAFSTYDSAETTLLRSGDLSHSSLDESDVIPLFLFARHVREAANTVKTLLDKVEDMQKAPYWPRIYLPSYPLSKAVYRTNRQVRHDRGGITAGSYQVTFADIAKLLDKIKSREHRPHRTSMSPHGHDTCVDSSHPTMDSSTDGGTLNRSGHGLGYKVWLAIHRLQGYESRYAFKVCLITSLLSVPSFLAHDDWWDRYQVWWAVAVSWSMIHPQVGGNLQDLVTRAFAAILGAVWAAAGYAAGHGNRYVMGVFAAIFMIPMLYRFTQSTHPRSGQVACLSFTVISISIINNKDSGPVAQQAVFQGLAFLVGTIVPVIVNWVLWPFIARHELRFALSSMMFFMSIIYRSVVSKYVYFEEGMEPTPDDIERSEMLEGRLREGFVRIRQLLVLTRHELRLRAPFDVLPYSALAEACERFFDYLIAVRQTALIHSPTSLRDNTEASEFLLGYRRDAVAAVLANLYILAGALRSRRPVPMFLPSAAAARKKLMLRRLAFQSNEKSLPHEKRANWSDIYSYSYRESFTGCVAQLEELEKYTKLIVGEQG